jgi:hypothetical protein
MLGRRLYPSERGTIFRAAVGVLAALLNLGMAAAAQQKPTLEPFSQLSADALSNTIVRIDYHGPEGERLPGLTFSVSGEVDWSRLRSVPGLEVSDWEAQGRIRPLAATVEDMKAFLRGPGRMALPKQDAATHKLELEPWFSVAVVAGRGAESKAFLGWITREKAGEFFILEGVNRTV